MKKINVNLGTEQINILTQLYKEKKFAAFNAEFAEQTGLIEVSDLVDKVNELRGDIAESRKIFNAGVDEFLDRTESEAANLVGQPVGENKNKNYFDESSMYRFPDFVTVSETIKPDFRLLREMSYMLADGYSIHIKKSEKEYNSDNLHGYYHNHSEISKYIVKTYNLSIKFKSLDEGMSQ